MRTFGDSILGSDSDNLVDALDAVFRSQLVQHIHMLFLNLKERGERNALRSQPGKRSGVSTRAKQVGEFSCMESRRHRGIHTRTGSGQQSLEMAFIVT
jgi:hypothetical protein